MKTTKANSTSSQQTNNANLASLPQHAHYFSRNTKRLSKLLSLIPMFFLSGLAHADGLADLKSAMTRLQGQTPFKAHVEAKTWNKQGEGKDAEEAQGQASVNIEDGPRGLQVFYSKEVLARIETEEKNAKEKSQRNKSPTLSGLREFSASDLRSMISATGYLNRMMERGNFKSERAENYGGKPSRVVSFDIPVERLSERERKYVKKFEATFDVWIAADGTPLASRLFNAISGRAFLVVSFETKNEEEYVFSVVGDRLIALRKESKNSGSGAGEKGESKVVITLEPQST